jgi:hypothetical protein
VSQLQIDLQLQLTINEKTRCVRNAVDALHLLGVFSRGLSTPQRGSKKTYLKFLVPPAGDQDAAGLRTDVLAFLDVTQATHDAAVQAIKQGAPPKNCAVLNDPAGTPQQIRAIMAAAALLPDNAP